MVTVTRPFYLEGMNETCDRNKFFDKVSIFRKSVVVIEAVQAEIISHCEIISREASVAKLPVAKLSAGAILEAIGAVGAVGEKRCWTLLFWASSFNTLRLKPNR